ncbi:MAG TPA: ATP-binding cassette domain-containing protein, partial [Steroidobacteraceae bacterium]|nr:ATP-binding cassette domain-containing protein [Steroidobacteraceae bacterium]
MALFFFVAGYFSHLMFHRKGTAGFVGDRIKRIGVPMLLGWLAFGPMTMGMMYMGLAPHVVAVAGAAPSAPAATPFPLSHLWFLYYLLMFYGAALSARHFFIKHLDPKSTIRRYVDNTVSYAVRKNKAPLLLAAPLAVCLYFTKNWVMWSGVPTPDSGFAPQMPALIGFGTAFVFGWLMHRQSDLLTVMKQRWVMHLAAGVVLSAASLWTVENMQGQFPFTAPYVKLAYVIFYTAAMWNWVFGIIGTALRFCSDESPTRRYLADASYWMYLAHLPLVFALQMVVLKWDLHWAVKFPFIVIVAVSVLLLSYHFLVRNTYIGEILNGRKYTSAKRTAVAPATKQITSDPTVVAELASVRKRYGTNLALDGVDLKLHAGEVLAFLGPNGAGKSTSVACLLGLQEPDEGSVTVFGESPQNIGSRRQVGAMLQNVDLPPEMRVRELIDLSCSYYAAPMSVDEVLQLTHTTTIAKRPYAKLSGGQKRLVQFAIAVCGRPKLLFLDEPTVGMDIQAREMVWATLRQLVKEGCSVVLTTHYLEEAEALADRVAVLAKGKVIVLGTVNEVRACVACKQISCISTLSVEQVQSWPGVISASQEAGRLNLSVSDADSIAGRLMREDAGCRELEIGRAGLAEAFTKITQEAA